MNKKAIKILVCLCVLLSFTLVNAQSTFQLKDSFKESDVNYSGISNINTFSPEEMLDSVFNIKAGKYEIYRFIRETVIQDEDIMLYMDKINEDGINTIKINVEIIVLKIKKNKIIEAYYYPLNWREFPFSSALLMSKKKIKFKRFVNIDDLIFENYDADGVNLLEKGVVLTPLAPIFNRCVDK
ncbi:hypothetical protein FACS189434_14330 [Bacteroidia bacterium]|nr:hypothetical protein FACS189434_14330 [Bacteroidia bacterium]